MSSIPPTAKKVFTGVIFDVYQWDQEMYDGSIAVFEKLRRAGAAQVIPITTDKKFVITEQEQPTKPSFITFPGGRIERDEEPIKAAARELLEETGYTGKDFTLMKSAQPQSKIDWTIYTYIAYNCQKVAEQNLDSGEKVQVKLISFDELIDLAFDDRLRDIDLSLLLLRAKIKPSLLAELKTQFRLI